MNCEDAQRQTALIRVAAIATGVQAASNETRAAALSDAIRHSVTYIECIREGLLLRIMGLGMASSANSDLFPMPNVCPREDMKSTRKTAFQDDLLIKGDATGSEEIAA